MRIAIAVVVALILGILGGVATAMLRVNKVPWDGETGGRNLAPDVPRVVVEGQPIAVIDHEEYDFGVMDVNDKGKHDFVIKNEGRGVLTLKQGKTSCHCTLSEIDKTALKAGESAKIHVTWTAKGYVGKFRQSATVHTNDPAHESIELVITGRVTTPIQTLPSEMVFGTVFPGTPVTEDIPLYCYLEGEPLEVTSFTLANRETAHNFEITFEPLPEDLLEREENAKSGQLVKVRIDPDAEPGLPPGDFEQKILVATNLGKDGSVKIPIKGKVASDISVYAPGAWYEDKNVLVWGTIDAQAGAEHKFKLYVRGPHREKVDFQVEEVFPKILNVEIGQRRELGEISEFTMTIRIPPDSRPGNYLGSPNGKAGEILLKTNHPDVEELRIRVSFLVEG